MYKSLLLVLAGVILSWTVLAETPSPNPEAVDSGNSGMSTSIQVHGHWKLDVYESDGTLVRVVEFDNDLIAWGGSVMVVLLRGRVASGGMFVTLINDGGTKPCEDLMLTDEDCVIVPADMVLYSPPNSMNLTQTPLGGGDEILQLQGSVTIENNSSITSVRTSFKRCEDMTNADCLTAPVQGTPPFTVIVQAFTEKTLSPVAVATGQIVQVTVTISFT